MAINDISLTSGMRSNLLSLQNTVTLLNRTQGRLATGKKVNTAIDNPVSYFASQNLTSRASKIDSLKDAMGQAIQTITAADKGITAITTMIEQAKGIAQSALSAAAGTTAAPETEDMTGAVAFSAGTVDIDVSAMGGAETIAFGGVTCTQGVDFATAAELAALIDAEGYTTAVVGDVITVSKNGVTVGTDEFTPSAGIVVAVGDAEAAASTFTVNGTVYTAGEDFAVGIDDAATATNFATFLEGVEGVATATADGANVTVTFDEVASTELTALQNQYNEMRTQITALAGDSGYKGKNLLNADTMTVKFEGSTMDVVGFDASATGLGIAEATWTAGGNIDADLDLLDAALDTLSQNASGLSGNLSIITVRQDFSTNMINTLTEGSDKLTLADTNEEGANMLMLQTRQSLATTALSLSAQAAQSVLQLFR